MWVWIQKNGGFPLAYAIVESETLDSWKWFLNCLGDDLDLYSNSSFIFINDKTKGKVTFFNCYAILSPNIVIIFCSSNGIIPALKVVSQVLSIGIVYIHENMNPKWRGHMYKELLRICAAATTVQCLKKQMNYISTVDLALDDWLKEIP